MKIRNIILSIICLLMTNLNAISLRDYIAQHGIPQIGSDFMLDLSHRNLTDLDGLNDIPGIEHVESLCLDYNKLTELSNDIFHNLVNLITLSLSNNQLRKLPEDIFHRLVNLTHLKLSNNKLSELPNNIFHNLVHLKLLDIHQNELIELPYDIFSGLINLEDLYLFSNKLNELPENIFNGLVNLKFITLFNNQITELSNDIFNELINLETLILFNNKIKLNNNEFKNKYLNNNRLLYKFQFKSEQDEAIERIQRELVQYILKRNMSISKCVILKKLYFMFRININLVRFKRIKQQQQYPYAQTVTQSDTHNDNALHLALQSGDIYLVKKIFDIMPECMHRANKQGKTPMHLLLLFEIAGKNEEYNMVFIIAFLKYIFNQDPSLAQLLYQPDNEGINPIESLIPAGREKMARALVKLT